MASGGLGSLHVEGYDQFRRAVRTSTDRDLPRRLGEAHRRVGQLVIARLQPRPDPAAVGEGAGATVRPSASKREVLLRAGSTHRAGHTPYKPWGRRRVLAPGAEAPPRPYIRGTAEANADEIGGYLLRAVTEAFDPAFHDTRP